MNDKRDNKEYYKFTKIFVVDDSELSRINIIQTLEEHEFNVVGHAGSAKECLAQMSPEVNLLIADVVMPETSGIELAKLLNQNMSNTHIIMISSLTQEHILLESISAGAKDFLVKPFKSEDLISSVIKISEIIRKHHSYCEPGS